MANCGFGTRLAVLAMYAAGFGFGALALLVRDLGSRTALEITAAVALVALCAVALLEKAPYERQVRKSKAAG